MNIKPIKTKKDYESALKRIDELWGCKKNSPEGDEFEILIMLTEKYEEEHFPVDAPDPVETLKFYMEQTGMKKSELAKYLGHKSRVTEILQKKRKLTLPMIRSLHYNLKIPVASLIKDY